ASVVLHDHNLGQHAALDVLEGGDLERRIRLGVRVNRIGDLLLLEELPELREDGHEGLPFPPLRGIRAISRVPERGPRPLLAGRPLQPNPRPGPPFVWRADHPRRRARGRRRKDYAAVSLLHEKLQPIGAGSGYGIASLVLPGHPIPATLFNGLSSLPAIDFREGLELFVGVWLLHELGDADRRLARQDRLAGPRSAGAGGCPATPPKADDRCDDGPHNEAPDSILNLRCTLGFH